MWVKKKIGQPVEKIIDSFLIKWMRYYLNKKLAVINVVDKT